MNIFFTRIIDRCAITALCHNRVSDGAYKTLLTCISYPGGILSFYAIKCILHFSLFYSIHFYHVKLWQNLSNSSNITQLIKIKYKIFLASISILIILYYIFLFYHCTKVKVVGTHIAKLMWRWAVVSWLRWTPTDKPGHSPRCLLNGR